MATTECIGGTWRYVIVVIMTFVALQSIVVVMHEFTHSTVAWLLGCMQNPLDIVWGNPLMMTGWDEGVHYSKLFPSGHNVAEAIIGGSPLVLHTTIVTLGFFFSIGHGETRRNGFIILFIGSSSPTSWNSLPIS